MNEMICLAGSSLIQFGGASITLQPKDSWVVQFGIQALAVFIGALAAGAINYYLQKRSFEAQHKLQMESFRIQNERDKTNLQIAAYTDLLGAISRYESLPDGDLIFHMLKASINGSLEVSRRIKASLNKLGEGNTSDFNKSLSELRLIMVAEMGLSDIVNNKRFQFSK